MFSGGVSRKGASVRIMEWDVSPEVERVGGGLGQVVMCGLAWVVFGRLQWRCMCVQKVHRCGSFRGVGT